MVLCFLYFDFQIQFCIYRPSYPLSHKLVWHILLHVWICMFGSDCERDLLNKDHNTHICTAHVNKQGDIVSLSEILTIFDRFYFFWKLCNLTKGFPIIYAMRFGLEYQDFMGKLEYEGGLASRGLWGFCGLILSAGVITCHNIYVLIIIITIINIFRDCFRLIYCKLL